MENISRRRFCGTALLALPLLCLHAQGAEDLPDDSDGVLDALADEITRIAADGAQNGFKAEHFRRCAGVIRTFDARLEEKGTNRNLNSRLEDDDYYKLNASVAAQRAVDYWDKHGMHFNKDDLMAQLTMSPTVYREMKRDIKRMGGVRALHATIADTLEQKAKEYETAALRGSAAIRNGRVVFHSSVKSRGAEFVLAQMDYSGFRSINCLCRAMAVEGALLAIACLFGCPPCCAPGAFLLATEKLLEGLGICNPNAC